MGALGGLGDELSTVVNLATRRDERKRAITAFCEVGGIEALEPLFRALDGINRDAFRGIIASVKVG
jgi:hypothetical protein